jgi:hypothetical protein
MADINVVLKQKNIDREYEKIHYETKTNLCTHDGANLETEVDALKVAVDTDNDLYIDKSVFDIEKVKYALTSIDLEAWVELPLVSSDFVYSEGYSVRLKRTAINTLIIEGEFKFIVFPDVGISSPPTYIVLCDLPSYIVPPSQSVGSFIIFNKTTGRYGQGIFGNEEARVNIYFEDREIRLYNSTFRGNWDNPSFKENEFSFQIEYYYDWL